ncbi:hypothetical protein GCM10009560_74040 [Nonomuraea longicatena]|uniref:Transposase n=1 Tax=Nonomuraea longicatena TaxID=83682 RepID=A0ABP4BN84_9ACTN
MILYGRRGDELTSVRLQGIRRELPDRPADGMRRKVDKPHPRQRDRYQAAPNVLDLIKFVLWLLWMLSTDHDATP